MAEKFEIVNEAEWGRDGLIENLVWRALVMAGIKPKDPVVIEDWDLRRVTLIVDGVNHGIRMWNIRQVGKTITVRWSLYYHKEGETGSTDILSSMTLVFNEDDYRKTKTPENPDTSIRKVREVRSVRTVAGPRTMEIKGEQEM